MYILCRNRERKCAAACEYIYFYVEDYVAASRNISMFFKERAAASENILTTASEIYSKKKCATASERYGGLYMTYILIHFFYNTTVASQVMPPLIFITVDSQVMPPVMLVIVYSAVMPPVMSITVDSLVMPLVISITVNSQVMTPVTPVTVDLLFMPLIMSITDDSKVTPLASYVDSQTVNRTSWLI